MFSSHNTNYMSSWDDHPSEIRDRVIADYSAPVTDIDFSENYGQFADSSAPVCSCGIPCVKLMSRTSANLNREFFTCASKEANRCNFFQWVDGESSRYVQTTSGGFDPSLVKDFVVANKRIFGHNFFREGQKECIEAALQGIFNSFLS